MLFQDRTPDRVWVLRGEGESRALQWHFSNGKDRILTDRRKCKGGSSGSFEQEDTKGKTSK